MGIGAFTDKNHEPTNAELLKTIGPMVKAWEALAQHLRDTYPVQEDFKFMYGKKYGWALRFRVKGALLTSLYPVPRGFTVQVILKPAALEEAQRLALGENTRLAIAKAHPYPEGKWLFIRIESKSDVQDIQKLLVLKHGMMEKRKAAGG